MQDKDFQTTREYQSLDERKLRWRALGAVVLPLVALFGLWPYQHWDGVERVGVLGGWAAQVLKDSEWYFCLAVPPLVAWLIHRNRVYLKALPLEGSWWGVAGMLVGMALYWMGYKVDTGYLGFAAFHATLGGLVLLIGGRAWARALFFPWLFLAFMWPMFPLEERLAFPLRMMTASVSGVFVNLIGVPVVREGTALFSAADGLVGLAQGALFRLDVEEPCSGIRSLFSLMMVSALYGYLTLKSPARRLVLFLSAIPLAMAGNFVRMVMLAVASQWFGSDFAVGRNIDGHQEMSFFHSMAGFAVFAVALAGMFGVCSVLERRHWRRVGKAGTGKSSALPAPGTTAGKGNGLAGIGAAIALSAAGLGICWMTDASLRLAEPGVSLALPLETAKYRARVLEMTAAERDVLDEGVELARHYYVSPEAKNILTTVIVGGPGKRTLHRPEVCLPGQGWTISSSDVITLKLDDGRELEGTLLRLFRDARGSNGQMVRVRGLNLYWYVGSDGTTRPDYYGHIAKGYADALLRNLNHRWSMISVFLQVSESPVGEEDFLAELAALEEMKVFVQELAPSVMKRAD